MRFAQIVLLVLALTLVGLTPLSATPATHAYSGMENGENLGIGGDEDSPTVNASSPDSPSHTSNELYVSEDSEGVRKAIATRIKTILEWFEQLIRSQRNKSIDEASQTL